MGLDKKLASSRVNRYETEVSGIDLDGLGRLADVLGVPMAYLVAEDASIAEAILALSQLPVEKRRSAVLALVHAQASTMTPVGGGEKKGA